MSLAEEYRRQLGWRDWDTILNALPLKSGELVLDLGCGPGDISVRLAALGARVIGIDANEELLADARSKCIPRAEFRQGDVRTPDLEPDAADGIWCSFTAAYFPQFAPVAKSWLELLKPGGWIAVTEIEDLFGHEPLSEASSALLKAYGAESLRLGRYDFSMGGKLRAYLEAAGAQVERSFNVRDRELCFDGTAASEILRAWSDRFDRMRTLQQFAGAQFGALKRDFLACLGSPDHRSRATVQCCIARRPA